MKVLTWRRWEEKDLNVCCLFGQNYNAWSYKSIQQVHSYFFYIILHMCIALHVSVALLSLIQWGLWTSSSFLRLSCRAPLTAPQEVRAGIFFFFLENLSLLPYSFCYQYTQFYVIYIYSINNRAPQWETGISFISIQVTSKIFVGFFPLLWFYFSGKKKEIIIITIIINILTCTSDAGCSRGTWSGRSPWWPCVCTALHTPPYFGKRERKLVKQWKKTCSVQGWMFL